MWIWDDVSQRAQCSSGSYLLTPGQAREIAGWLVRFADWADEKKAKAEAI